MRCHFNDYFFEMAMSIIVEAIYKKKRSDIKIDVNSVALQKNFIYRHAN